MASWLGAGLVLVACATDATSGSPEGTGRTSSAVWVNGGFETGAAGAAPPAPWVLQTFINDGITVQTPQTYAGLDLVAGGKPLTTEIAATNQPDPDLGAGASLRVCRYGAQCARVNFHSSTAYGNGQNVNILSQSMTVAPGDVDPSDGQIHVRFAVAPVLQNPAHPANEQPYYFVILTDVTKATTLYSDFNLSGTAGLAWQKINAGTPNEIDYTNWQLVDVSGAGGAIAQGDTVQVQFIASGCSLGGHFGELYVDGVGSVIPGISIEGTAPAQANAGTDITYSLTYKNGSNAAETGVVIDFTTPPNTTFQSIVPPAGATCTTPAVGTAGTIVCTFTGAVPAGASGGLSITVAIAAGTTGTITEGNYQISSTQETAILGPPIYTVCGCTQDSNCLTGNWCDETLKDCEPTLANGTAIPTDPPHTNPTLNGTCTPAAGALVCTSAVCDTHDNECGYANGDGPCTSASGPVVCRSGACSVNGTCEPAGGCNVDADCSGADWCDESTHVCTPKIANGGAVPTDPAHMNPTLNGTCTAQAGALVCVSGVCDTGDNECGYANGDGPCTPGSGGNGGVVCRSGACSVNGTCEPAGGCNVDADCAAADWCDESTHVCTPKIANGGAVPTDPAHTNPTLNGTCTAQAGALACVSGVCDTHDNECGYANGDGPCTVATGGVVCRSGQCSANGTCEPAGSCDVDADCTGGNWCDESTHTCTPPIANGGAVPSDPPHMNPTLNGTCTAPAGALVCASGVCDTVDNKCGYANGDGTCSAGDAGNGGTVCRSGVCDPNDSKCGYANGDGPCTMGTGATVCRSGMCSTNGTCEPAGGCDTDADCSGADWCDESTHTCTPKIANGGSIPDDPAHTNPTVNGTCTPAAGAVVCASGVCDTHDDKCGYANGDGPCTAGDGGDGSPECRSNVCATTGSNAGLCEGCTVNSECPSGEVCSATNTCVSPMADAGVDSGSPGVDSGSPGVDGSAGDSGTSAMDGSTSADGGSGEDAMADATTEAGVDASDTGIIEGGGCSSAGVSRGGFGGGAWLGGLSLLGLLTLRKRSARRGTR